MGRETSRVYTLQDAGEEETGGAQMYIQSTQALHSIYTGSVHHITMPLFASEAFSWSG